eukprot:scaffold715_cov217-Chaetoceros_neogracile.AAC.3
MLDTKIAFQEYLLVPTIDFRVLEAESRTKSASCPGQNDTTRPRDKLHLTIGTTENLIKKHTLAIAVGFDCGDIIEFIAVERQQKVKWRGSMGFLIQFLAYIHNENATKSTSRPGNNDTTRPRDKLHLIIGTTENLIKIHRGGSEKGWTSKFRGVSRSCNDVLLNITSFDSAGIDDGSVRFIQGFTAGNVRVRSLGQSLPDPKRLLKVDFQAWSCGTIDCYTCNTAVFKGVKRIKT